MSDALPEEDFPCERCGDEHDSDSYDPNWGWICESCADELEWERNEVAA